MANAARREKLQLAHSTCILCFFCYFVIKHVILDYPHKHWANYGVKELWTICYHPAVPQRR